MGLLQELQRRNVIRMAGLYLVGAWIVVQVASTLLPVFEAPAWVMKVLVGALAVGFAGALIFSWVFELTPEGIKRDAQVPPERSIGHVTGRRMDRIIIALLVVALGWFALDKFVLAPRQAASTAAAPAPAGGGDKSIAVLPFVDMSSAKDQEYLSDGLAEEVLNLLAKIPELRVTSRSSAFSFKGKAIDVPSVAKQLGVAHVLEGSVRKSGNQVRVTVQLIDALRDVHLWSETYDRPLGDIFAIEDQISAAVVEQLKVRLLGTAPKARATDPEAYALVLKARQLYRLGDGASLEQSVALYRQALQIAPDYAEGWVGLASACALQAGRAMRPVDEAIRDARDANQHALDLAPDMALAHTNLGWIATLWDADLPTAAAHMERGLKLNPRDAEILRPTSLVALTLGRADLAEQLMRAAVTLDPTASQAWATLARVQRSAGKYDESIESARHAIAVTPGAAGLHHYLVLSLVLRAKGTDLDDARKEALAEPDESYRLIALGLAEAGLGHRDASDKALAELAAKSERDAAYNIAYIYGYRGDADPAFAYLEKAIAYHDTGFWEVSVQPLFKPIHADPRWHALMERLGRTPEQIAAIHADLSLPATPTTAAAP